MNREGAKGAKKDPIKILCVLGVLAVQKASAHCNWTAKAQRSPRKIRSKTFASLASWR